jgi:4-hydroxy-tetrahydrodipicolinate synthase
MKIDHSSKGVFVIAATPFEPDGSVDYGSVDSLTDFYFGCGASGLTVLGILGEATKLEANEGITIARRFIERAGGRPVIVGVSAPGFAAMRALARSSMDAGAAGVMIAPVPSLRTDQQILDYFRQAVAEIGEDVPVCVQDHPLVTGVQMSTSVVERVMSEHDSCVMLKHEDWPGLDKLTALRVAEDEGRLKPLSILCGNGGIFLDFEMDRGADGAMTGYAFPDMLADLVRHAQAGERDAAHDLFDAHLPLLRYEQQPGLGLAIRKHILVRRGAIRHDAMRSPRPRLSSETAAEVDYLLRRLAKVDTRAALA